MNALERRVLALRVECPFCKAKAGLQCRNTVTRELLPTPHGRRQTLAVWNRAVGA